MHLSLPRSGLILAAATLALVMTSCSSGAADDSAPSVEAVDAGAAEATPTTASEDGEDGYAFGTDRDQIATAIDEAFATKNGKARWEGDTLVLAIDGDASATMAGFTQCRALAELLLEDDASVVEFPNGQIACADVLPPA